MAISYRLPDLHSLYSLKAILNPDYEEVAPASSQWMLSYVHRIPELCGKAHAFKRTASELLAAYTYPRASAEQLRVCCDFVNILFVIDEITDVQKGHDAAASTAVLMSAMAADGLDDDSALAQLVKDFRQRFFPCVGPATARRFLKFFEEYLGAVVTEASMREEHVVLDVESYDAQRRACSATNTAFGLFGYVLGVDLPDEVFEHPEYKELYLSAVDMVTWANDLYSYNMEQAMGHYAANILTVLQKEKNITLQEASDLVGYHFKTLIDRFEGSASRLPSFGADVDGTAAKYVLALKEWVVGNIEWSFATQRYFGQDHAVVKETLIVNLYPKRTA